MTADTLLVLSAGGTIVAILAYCWIADDMDDVRRFEDDER